MKTINLYLMPIIEKPELYTRLTVGSDAESFDLEALDRHRNQGANYLKMCHYTGSRGKIVI